MFISYVTTDEIWEYKTWTHVLVRRKGLVEDKIMDDEAQCIHIKYKDSDLN